MSNETPNSRQPAIRIACAADAASVHAIVDAAYRSYIPRIGKPPGPMLDNYAQRIADGQVWILADTSGIVGILVLEETADGLLLDNIAVAPGQQGKGHGRTLLEFAETQAKRRGWNEIQLYTNALMTENIALYHRIGYLETVRVTEKGFDRVYMVKQLTAP
ncbi:MAG TPA: GNAT family N-acetyltransferase [Acetobacteraceae bacterium]|jgi:GNAT superfamily N-acetyltransferase|nr:GNAT family N-acetyltransferase [Acetobacteraceae bacterium]